MTIGEAVARAIDRIAERKCMQQFDSSDLKSEVQAIAKESGSKAKDPMASVRQQLQKMRDNGLVQFLGAGKYAIVGGGKLTAQAAPKTASSAAAAGSKKKTAVGGKRKRSAPQKKVKKAGSGKKKSRSRSGISFETYIYRVLKQIAPQTGLSGTAMQTLQGFATDLLKRLGETAFDLVQRDKRKTLSARDFQTAVRLVMFGQLAKHAVADGLKAMTKYNAGHVGKAGGTRSERAGLVMSVARVERFLRAMMPHTNVAESAPVFAAAVLEYALSEVMELASNAARDAKRKRITPRHLSLVIQYDEELTRLFNENAFIARGGVMPDIHAELLPSKKQKK